MANEVKYISKAIAYTNTTAFEVGQLPAGASIVRISVAVDTAFDAGTTNVVDVGISSDTDKFANDIDVSSAGIVAGTVAATAVQSTNDPTIITAIYVPSGTAATAGAGQVIVEYVFR